MNWRRYIELFQIHEVADGWTADGLGHSWAMRLVQTFTSAQIDLAILVQSSHTHRALNVEKEELETKLENHTHCFKPKLIQVQHVQNLKKIGHEPLVDRDVRS